MLLLCPCVMSLCVGFTGVIIVIIVIIIINNVCIFKDLVMLTTKL